MSETTTPAAGMDQVTFWNQEGGPQWVARQQAWDVTMKPISDAALVRAGVEPGEAVIDIGCGCGATSLELAERVGSKGRVLGIDISKPMLDRAKERGAGNPVLQFVEADATTHAFEPGRTDLLFSRHGVMFFPEPERAFANLHSALKPGGRMVFSCFRTPKENPFLTLALAAATEHVPPLPKMAPDEPGPFAFAEPERVQRILAAGGFAAITLEPVDLQLDVGSGKGLDEAVTNALVIGPAARALRGQPDDARAKVEAAIRKTLAAQVRDGKVLLAAAIWIVSAKQG